jgi:hypothetical protein
MASTQRRYGKEEFARRGDEVYERQVHPLLTADDDGRFAAIDIDSGEYEVADEELVACDRLRRRLPDAQIWLVKIGSRFVHRFGSSQRRNDR